MNNIMKKVAFVLSCVLLLNVYLVAFANGNSENDFVFAENERVVLDTAKRTILIEDEVRLSELNEIIKSELINGALNLQVNSEYIDFLNGTLVINKDSYGITYLVLPIVGNGYSILSNIVIGFDEENSIEYYSETYKTKSEIYTFKVLALFNGNVIRNEVTNIEYIEDEDIIYTIAILNSINMNNIDARALDLACFAVVTGASGGVIASILKLCGTPCALLPPTWVGGIIVVGGVGIAGAVGTCWNN